MKQTEKSIVEVLRESITTREQIFGDLFFWESIKGENQITGYCALGALACEIGMGTEHEDDPPTYAEIVENGYGISNRLKKAIECPLHRNDDTDERQCSQEFSRLTEMIPHLNDFHKQSFGELAKILDKLIDDGTIVETTEIEPIES